MLTLILQGCFVVVGVALVLNLYAAIRGPSVVDRLLALDTMYINSIALLLLYGIYLGTSLNFEVALLIAMLGLSLIHI
mgnify:CR=1 FL=1